MPELPEVEITRQGLLKKIKHQVCTGAMVRETRFRKTIPSDLGILLSGQRLLDIKRRGKYLIWCFERSFLVSHLGMSGVLRVFPKEESVRKHDHVDIEFGDLVVRYHDPRRFGFIIWLDKTEIPEDLPEIKRLGVEPFSVEFNAQYLEESLRKITRSIKEVLLSGHVVVGVGNIYCSESLFEAGINPFISANKLSLKQLEKLVQAIRTILSLSLQEGGSTLKDFVSAEGKEGYFTLNAKVYARSGKPCLRCGKTIEKKMQNGRASYYCPHCQRV